MEIRVYDNTLMRVGIIENHTSLIWTRKYYEPGNFELHCPLTDANLSILAPGNIIAKDGTVEAGIIEDLTYTDGVDEKTIIAKGRFMSSYFDRRLIKTTFSYTGKTEVGMRSLISNVVAIPLVELGALAGFDETITFQATMKSLLSTLTKISKTSGLGYRLVPDFKTKKLIFEVYKGLDHSTAQTDRNRVIFSEQYDNLNQVEYQWNNQLEKTYAVVGGEGEGAERVYVYVGSGTGLDLKEVFVDAKDIRSEDFDTQEEYEDALRQKGYEALTNGQVAKSLEYVTEANANFKYKIDYDLGDIVTVRKRAWGINDNIRITEIQEIYENGGMTVVPTLGSTLPDTVDWSN